MQEHRLTLRLMRYWELIRKGRTYPEIIQFNAAAVEEIWPYCFRVSVQSQAVPHYAYEYMGEVIAGLYGRDLTGMVVNRHMKQFPGAVLHGKLDHVVASNEPLLDEGHFVTEQGKLIKYRACLLPFGNEKKGLTHIVVGLSCRVFG